MGVDILGVGFGLGGGVCFGVNVGKGVGVDLTGVEVGVGGGVKVGPILGVGVGVNVVTGVLVAEAGDPLGLDFG